uniref:Myeloid leukemia factor 1 isoform 5 n=1 Tax=Homo sapiens TaxID=9606 RepID=A0A0S2Z4B4_HUMAN|nr:myeloid leukemia factor 1 isoform 5 [Homo sapiens]
MFRMLNSSFEDDPFFSIQMSALSRQWTKWCQI